MKGLIEFLAWGLLIATWGLCYFEKISLDTAIIVSMIWIVGEMICYSRL